MRKFAFLSAIVVLTALAADRPDLSGKWVLDAAHSDASRVKTETLSIDQKTDAVQISEDTTESNGKEVKVDIACNTDGQGCKVKENGLATQVSFWYNGPILVMMEQRHGNDFVTQKKMKPSEDGKSLSMEVVYIAPPGHKPETYKFVKQ
ncbi:MAG TPA: hypothetical protein VG456_15675 [Candidatus Sulfopaludibacter sp.]|jgi:hypothetical protein|nr:hypothetical protein [Candidatus Sulfopaludibacter sp.]